MQNELLYSVFPAVQPADSGVLRKENGIFQLVGGFGFCVFLSPSPELPFPQPAEP